jgi:TatD DNase family protein
VNSEEIVSVSSLFLQDVDFQNETNIPFSTAIHPWHAAKFEDEQVSTLLGKLINQPNFIAIGETGLDKACTASYQRQKALFQLHVEYAEEHHKPLMVHAVKSWNDLIEYFKRAMVPCILHGYSEGITLTKQLIGLGCYFSVGKSLLQITPRFREAIQIIPNSSLFLETDDAQVSIVEIYREASKIVHVPLETLKIQINKNFTSLF